MVRGFVLLTALAMALSGVALTIGAVAAKPLVGSGGLSASLVVVLTVLLVTAGGAWTLSRSLLRLLSIPRPRLSPPGPPPAEPDQHE
jgi:hypothetical protein